MVHCWHACIVDDEKQDLPTVMYCSVMMYNYYYLLGFYPIKHNEEEKDINNEIFNHMPHFTKTRLCVDCLQDVFKCT